MLAFDGFASFACAHPSRMCWNPPCTEGYDLNNTNHRSLSSHYLLLDHKEWPASVPPHTEGGRALFANMFHQQSSSTSPSEGKLGHEYVDPPPLMVALFTAVFSFLPPQLQLFEWPIISQPQQVRSVHPPTAAESAETSSSEYLLYPHVVSRRGVVERPL